MKRNSFLIVFSSLFFLIGCAELSRLSKDRGFHQEGSLILSEQRLDIFETIAAAGKSMNFSVFDFDQNAGCIRLVSHSRSWSFRIPEVGRMTSAGIMVTAQDGGKQLDIWACVVGDFGTKGQEMAAKFFNVFKNRLRERLSNQ